MEGSREAAERSPLLMLSSSPHVHGTASVRGVMRDVLIALAPAVAVGLWVFGLPALRVLALSVGGCLLAEWACLRLRRRGAWTPSPGACWPPSTR